MNTAEIRGTYSLGSGHFQWRSETSSYVEYHNSTMWKFNFCHLIGLYFEFRLKELLIRISRQFLSKVIIMTVFDSAAL